MARTVTLVAAAVFADAAANVAATVAAARLPTAGFGGGSDRSLPPTGGRRGDVRLVLLPADL